MHWTYVNAHRDRSKRFQPYPLSDFLSYAPKNDQVVAPIVGKCARGLEQDDLWPDWCLWAWEKLEKVGEGIARRGCRALSGHGVFIIAPVITEDSVSGFAIVKSEMVGDWVEVRNVDRPDDEPIQIEIPDLFLCDTGASAEADAWFKVVQYA